MHLKRSAGVALSGIAAAAGLVSASTYRKVFRRSKTSAITEQLCPDSDFLAAQAAAAERLRARPCTRHCIRSASGAMLYGWYYCCRRTPCGKVAVILHDYQSNHLQAAGMISEYYFSRGFDVFCPDHAAHGESEGSRIGFGSYETSDCLAWLDLLISIYGKDLQIVLHGFSMGASIACRMSSKIPAAVRFIVSDSAFTSAFAAIRNSSNGIALPLRVLNWFGGSYDLATDTDARFRLASARCPILFIHGEKDPLVPLTHTLELYEHCSSAKASLLVPEAGHCTSFYCAPDLYSARLDAFAEKYIV